MNLAALEALPQGQREAAIKALEELEAAFTFNPMLGYVPASCAEVHPQQLPGPEVCDHRCKHAAFHASQVPSKWLFGGNRAGKTTTAIADDLIQATPRELLPDHLLGYKRWECPFYCRVMAPDMQRTMIPVIHQKFREWTPKELLKRGSFDASYDKAGQTLRLECGCRFDFLSYEMDLDKFGGAALHRVHYDECPPLSIRTECLMRLVDFNGDEIGSLTPLKGLDWMYRTIFLNDSDPNIFKTVIGIAENPHLSREARERIIGSIVDAREREAREFGLFVHFGGLVYPDFRHVLVPRLSRDRLRELEHVCGIDPGVRYAGITMLGFDGENRSHTFAARKLANATVPEYVEYIRSVYGPLGVSLDDVHFVIDPAARARSLVNAENVQDELARYGIFAGAGQNAVEPGVQQIRRRIKSGWCQIADCEETLDLVEELEMYRLDVDADADDGQFKVLKQHDHVCDAWRYAHMERPWLPEGAFDALQDSDKLPWWAVASGPPRPAAPFDGSPSMGAMA